MQVARVGEGGLVSVDTALNVLNLCLSQSVRSRSVPANSRDARSPIISEESFFRLVIVQNGALYASHYII